jgi:hypothetical protein
MDSENALACGRQTLFRRMIQGTAAVIENEPANARQ